jgi:putative MATE family efflux protein
MLLLAVFSLVTGAFGILAGRLLLGWMGAEGGLLTNAYAFFRVIMLGLWFMEMLPCADNIIRGAGYPEYTLSANAATVVVMLVAEPIFVLGLGPVPAMGAAGAGWGIVLGSMAGAAIQLAVMLRGDAGTRLRPRYLVPDLPLIGRLTRIALPATAQRLSFNLANALFMAVVTGFGEAVLVAYSVVNRVTGFLMCPITGVGMATATLVGQNLGADQERRATRAVRMSLLGTAGTALALIGLLNLWPLQILGLFTDEPDALRLGVLAARFTLYTGLVSAANRTISSALSGAGDTLSPMLINIGAEYLVQLPLVWTLTNLVTLGPPAVWLALACGQTVAALLMARTFRRGRWKTLKV